MKRLKDVRGIRAQRFIGQSAGKGEFDAKGMPQKEQRDVVRRFRSGDLLSRDERLADTEAMAALTSCRTLDARP